MLTYTAGTTPPDVIRAHCPEDGYNMRLNQSDWWTLAQAVNQGIDSHLEAFTRSTFNNGHVWIHPDELHILCRRLSEQGTEDADDFRSAILATIGIEEI